MTSTLKIIAIGIFVLILLMCFQFFCSKEQRKKVDFIVKRLPHLRTVNFDDHSLAEWDSSFIVMKITHREADTHQRQKLTLSHDPKALHEKDINLKVYMARDSSYWYIGVEVIDVMILSVPPNSAKPYSGDCLEIFFAGDSLESPLDIEALVKYSHSAEQAIFCQILIPAVALDSISYYFPDYRTDSAFKKNALHNFKASTWKIGSRWFAEVRIPLKAFEAKVVSRIDRHEPLKMNIDYLDYDIKLAEDNQQDNWGFKPDNVFCLDDEEKYVNKPKFMRTVIFE